MTKKDAITSKVPMRHTASVAMSNASGGAGNGMLVAFMMFGLGRHFGGQENIPHDVLEILPWVVIGIGILTHSVTEWFARDRHVIAETAGMATGD